VSHNFHCIDVNINPLRVSVAAQAMQKPLDGFVRKRLITNMMLDLT